MGCKSFKHSYGKQHKSLSFLMPYAGIDPVTKALQNDENSNSLAAFVLK